jgi:hypothetical protein
MIATAIYSSDLFNTYSNPDPGSTSTLFVVAIFLPELLAQLRVRLVHRGFAQLTRDDIVIAAVRNISRNRVRPAAAAGTTAISTTATLSVALTLLPLALALTALAGAIAVLTIALAVLAIALPALAGAVARTLRTAAFRFATGAAVCALAARAFSAACAATAPTALARNRCLFVTDRPIEHAEGNIELAVNLRLAFVLRHGATAAARTAAVRTAAFAACTTAAT